MDTTYAALMGVLVLLVILVAYRYATRPKSEKFGGPDSNSYASINQAIDALRGQPQDVLRKLGDPLRATLQKEIWYEQADSRTRAEKVAAAEQEQFSIYQDGTATGAFDTENGGDIAAEVQQHHAPVPEINYSQYMSDIVVDDRMHANHRAWVDGVLPYSGTAMTVDTLEVGDYVPFVGLRRPQAVAQQNNMLQITEVDSQDLASNPRFNFRG